jgi:hypothetical protein
MGSILGSTVYRRPQTGAGPPIPLSHEEKQTLHGRYSHFVREMTGSTKMSNIFGILARQNSRRLCVSHSYLKSIGPGRNQCRSFPDLHRVPTIGADFAFGTGCPADFADLFAFNSKRFANLSGKECHTTADL